MNNNKALRVGIVGCGSLGTVHARKFGQLDGVTVAALSDPSATAMERAAQVLPAAPELQETDFRQILHADLDMVCLATPDALHVEQAHAALAAGCHVLCEKPLTERPDELQELIRARDRAGKQFAMTYPRHYDPGVRRMREEIQSGRWGAVRFVTAYNAEDWVTPNIGTWRHDPALCEGGFFHDAAGHQLDTIFWVTALAPERVRLSVDNAGCPVPIVAWGEAALTGGVPLMMSFIGNAKKWREQVNIHCERMDFAMESGRAHWVQEGKLVPLEPPSEYGGSEKAFIALIRGEGPNWAPLEELWPIVRFTRAALDSARTASDSTI